MKRLKIKKKAGLWCLCALLAVGAALVTVFCLVGREAESAVVSAGTQQFAEDTYLAASAVVGQDITFTPEWFDSVLGGAPVSSVTVTALPPATDGVLCLGYGEVTVGQTIPRETLSYLRFTPANGVKSSSFSFVPATKDGGAGYALSCALMLSDTVNCCPTGTKAVTAVSTHQTVSLLGTLAATDPEGDRLYFEICDYPQNGTVSLDKSSGEFTYMPRAGFSGSDSFTWRVQDEFGAFTEEASVEITVRELSGGYTFSDMEGSANHTHALRVSEAGLFSGEQIGGKHYFHPTKAVTRAVFVAVLLEAAGIDAPSATDTGYADNAEIPKPMRGAVRYAREQGWLGDAESFCPNDPITRAEAARIAAAVLGLGEPEYSETVTDFSSIPVDVADALYAIYEGGYISTGADGSLRPEGELLRADAAKLFAKILDTRGK